MASFSRDIASYPGYDQLEGKKRIQLIHDTMDEQDDDDWEIPEVMESCFEDGVVEQYWGENE